MIYDEVNKNFIRVLNEIAKCQPYYSQSISNLQLDYIQTIKDMIQNTTSAQKQMAGGSSLNILPLSLVPLSYMEQFIRQLNEFTSNTITVSNINNQLTIIMLDILREGLDIYNRATGAVSKYNTDMAKAWNNFFF